MVGLSPLAAPHWDSNSVITSFLKALDWQAIGWAFFPILAWPVIYLVLMRLNIKPRKISDLSAALIATIETLTYRLGEAVKWLLPLMVLSVAGAVFLQSIFGISSTKISESSLYMQAIVIMVGAAAALLAGQHVRVDIFHSRMSNTAKARVDLWGFFVFLAPVCLILIWNSQSFVALSWAIKEGSIEADGFRGVYLLKTLLPVFALLMLLQGFAIALRAVLYLAGQPRPAMPAQHIPIPFPDPDLRTPDLRTGEPS